MDLAIVLYTISDDNLREEFSHELENQGFEKHPDQSTYTYPMNKVGEIFLPENFSNWLKNWSKGKDWTDSDFISIYYLSYIQEGSNFTTIRNKTFTLHS